MKRSSLLLFFCVLSLWMIVLCPAPAGAQRLAQTPETQTAPSQQTPRLPLAAEPKLWPNRPPAEPNETPPPKADFTAMKESGLQTVRSIIDPLTVQLDDGRTVHLAGLDSPDLDPYTPGDISLKASEVLRTLLTDQKVRLYVTPDSRTGRMNRMGHTLAHLERVTDGSWVQGALLEQGLARVRTSPSNPEMNESMLALERIARDAKIGLWSQNDFTVKSPETIDKQNNSFQIVEGVIEAVSTTRNRIYMNFGKNWKKDFTAGLEPEARQLFSKQGLKPLEWGGRRVRVRGWVRDWNGPYMDIDSPESIEFLDAGHVTKMAPALETLVSPDVPAPSVGHVRTAPPSSSGPSGGHITVTSPGTPLSKPADSSLAQKGDSGLKRPRNGAADREVLAEPLQDPDR